ncbi:MAG: Unknown protein [uncultured Sulfurovum sp.]|uniref:Uncharacterized protein n=1 Tax=uncultured Sulfurovum sp. TaxID=269237 RepID=A0A6S6S3G1_9BACT|nr:MAG: Unknown protein [uncultured Sulfurovum sp.]
MKKYISLGALFLSLSFFLLVSSLELGLSVEFMKLVLDGASIILWMILPIVITLTSFLIIGFPNEKLTFLVYVGMTLLFISNMTFLLWLNVATVDFGVIFIILFVWGSTFWFVVTLLIKLLYAYIFKKGFKEFIGYMVRVKIFQAFFLSVTVTFILLQLFLMGSSILAYKSVKVLDIKENKTYSLFYFYRPFISEIRLDNGMRWSYSRVKFVNDGH